MADRQQNLQPSVGAAVHGVRLSFVSIAAVLLLAVTLCSSAGEPSQPNAGQATAGAALCDVDLGRRVFGQCAICHTLEKDAASIVGPNLYGVAGRRAASAPGFKYSSALRAFGKEWSPEELDAFLARPMARVPGTSMAFAGLKKPEERAAVICFISRAGE